MRSDDITGKTSKSPFSTYDVFGYLIPGSAFIFICLIFDVWVNSNATGNDIHTPFLTAASTLINDQVLNNLTLSLIYLIMGAVITYVAGHIVASISAFSIDRLLTGKGYYYPFVSLTSDKESLTTKGSKDRVRGGFMLFNILIVSVTFIIFILGIIDISDSTKRLWALMLGSSLVISLIATFFYMTGRKDEEDTGVNWFIYGFAWLYNVSAGRIGYFTGTNKKLPDDIVEGFKDFTEKNFGTRELLNSDIYWLSYMFVASKSKFIYNHLVNWLHLYSYSRNLSTALYLSSIYVLIIISINKLSGIGIDMVSYLIFPILFFSAFIMLIRYYYLYVSYYSKFLIRACIFLSNDKD